MAAKKKAASKKVTTKKSSGESKKRAAGKRAVNGPGAIASGGAASKKSSARPATKTNPAKKAALKKAVSKKTAQTSAPKKSAAKKSLTRSTASAVARAGWKIPASATHLLDKKWLTSQREALISERAKYTVSADRLAAEAAALMADREPGDVQFDEESGEGDTIAVERDRDLALSAAARQAISEIDSALERLDSNTYGLCISGDGEDVIPQDRLEAIPEAAVCVQHKTSMF